jgi:hypothetical protein
MNEGFEAASNQLDPDQPPRRVTKSASLEALWHCAALIARAMTAPL